MQGPHDVRQPGRIVVVEGAPPAVPDPARGRPIGSGEQLRYWSLCTNEYRKPYPVTACAADRDIVLDDGRYTFVISTPEDRPANATSANGVTWLDWGSTEADNLLLLRHLLPDPTFAEAAANVVPGTLASSTMGPYAPSATYCPATTFQHGGAAACRQTTQPSGGEHMKKWMLRALAVSACATAALGPSGRVAAAHPGHGTPTRPLLLVGGTFGPVGYMDDARAYFQGQGFDVTTMQLSGSPPGSVDIKVSAQAICDQIDTIRNRTGAGTIDVVGHSQGALAARYCVKYQGGATKVTTMVSLGGPNYGTTRGSLVCQTTACRQMRPGSSFLAELNAGDDTPGAVNYVHLYSREEYGGLDGEDVPLADGATNLAAQDRCPGRQVEHRWEYDTAIMRDLIRDAVLREPLTTTCP